jgi:hypothetical protein
MSEGKLNRERIKEKYIVDATPIKCRASDIKAKPQASGSVGISTGESGKKRIKIG